MLTTEMDVAVPHAPPRWRAYFGASWAGLVGAVFGLGAALTPSLLPRPAVFEGILAGIGAVLGYGLGVLLAWAVRKAVPREPSAAVKRRIWRITIVAAPVLTVVWVVLGVRWQDDVRRLVGVSAGGAGSILVIGAIAVATFVVTLGVARALRRLAGWLALRLARVIPLRIAGLVATVLIALGIYWLISGVLFAGFTSLADRFYAGTNADTVAGISQPTDPARSGSPASLVSWESLGREGRNFVARGPSPAVLTAFSGRAAVEPIRIYVGVDTAPDAPSRAALAVRELERTGAFDRPVLVVAGTTGTGWLEPQSTDALEYLWNGDTAIVGIQYSYLPSWISTLVDTQRAADAGRELFDAVYARWQELPADDRPQLIAYGLSLGSFSIQSAFASGADLASRTDGALLVGSPNFSQPWGDITRFRDAGSPEWQPVYRAGESIRFASGPPAEALPSATGSVPRILYLQHASDPVVWWSTDLIAREPDWLTEPPGPDRSAFMSWFPVLTFAQVTVDQMVGTSVPNGHGHNYPDAIVSAWSAVVPAPVSSTAESARLQALIDTYATE
ncbi:alpha/beta hydrolase [Pengzhenrongella phosphoraccumulans]|uniref:alpha/beta hydrolase n=1 Tax=Pengzhenrongella phosphoraccumulans TaxID=3114394 RepID=UPI00388F93DE